MTTRQRKILTMLSGIVWTNKEALAVELGCSAATVAVDIAHLRAKGWPVQMRRGIGGGYALERPELERAWKLYGLKP